MEEKQISKTTRCKLDSSLKMHVAFFYPKDIQKIFLETFDLVENLEMTQIAGGAGIMFFASLWRNAYENRYVTYPLDVCSLYNNIPHKKIIEAVKQKSQSKSNISINDILTLKPILTLNNFVFNGKNYLKKKVH